MHRRDFVQRHPVYILAQILSGFVQRHPVYILAQILSGFFINPKSISTLQGLKKRSRKKIFLNPVKYVDVF